MLLKKYFMHRRGGLTCPPESVVSAQLQPLCAIKFTIPVGADLHIRPKVAFCTNPIACATKSSEPPVETTSD